MKNPQFQLLNILSINLKPIRNFNLKAVQLLSILIVFLSSIDFGFGQKSAGNFGDLRQTLRDGASEFAQNAGATEAFVHEVQGNLTSYGYYFVKSGHADVYNISISLPAIKFTQFDFLVNGKEFSAYPQNDGEKFTIEGLEIEIYNEQISYSKKLNFSVSGLWAQGKQAAYTQIAFTELDLQKLLKQVNGQNSSTTLSKEFVMTFFRVRVLNKGKLSESSFPKATIIRLIKERTELESKPAGSKNSIELTGSNSSSTDNKANKKEEKNRSSSISASPDYKPRDIEKLKQEAQERRAMVDKNLRDKELEELNRKWQAEKRADQLAERREEELKKEEEAANKERFNSRLNILSSQVSGSYPNSHTELILADKLYYFFYAYNSSILEFENIEMQISNVFSISRNSEGLWPRQSVLLNEIELTMGKSLGYSRINKQQVIVGHFSTIEEANSAILKFRKDLSETGVQFSSIKYSGISSSTIHNKFYLEAQKLFEEYDYQGAMKMYKMAENANGALPDYYIGMARCIYKIKPIENKDVNTQAIHYINMALAIDSTYSETYYSLARIYQDFTYNGCANHSADAVFYFLKAADFGNTKALQWCKENQELVNKKFKFRDSKSGMLGVQNARLQVIIPPSYSKIEILTPELFEVSINGKCGLISDKASIVMPVDYDYIFELGERFFAGINKLSKYSGDNKIDIYNISGRKVEDIGLRYCDVERFSEGLAAIRVNTKILEAFWGFIDTSGTFVIKPKYYRVGNFKNGLVRVSEEREVKGSRFYDEKWGLIDSLGNEVIPIIFDNIFEEFQEGLIAVEIGNKWGFADESGTVVIKAKYSDVESFKNGKALVTKGKRKFYIDKVGKKIKD